MDGFASILGCLLALFSNHEAHHNTSHGLLRSRAGTKFDEKCDRLCCRLVARFGTGFWNLAARCVSCCGIGVHSRQAYQAERKYPPTGIWPRTRKFTDGPSRLPKAIDHTNSQTLRHTPHETSWSHLGGPMLAHRQAQRMIKTPRRTATHHHQNILPLDISESPAIALCEPLQCYRSYQQFPTNRVMIRLDRPLVTCPTDHQKSPVDTCHPKQ